MVNLKEYKFLKCDDGIYFAKPLENGNISLNAYKLSDSDIINLFEHYLYNYCLINLKNILEIYKNNNLYIEAKLHLQNG